MSLILDALNRSQRERSQANEMPGIETQHHYRAPSPASRWTFALPWVGLVAALGVIAWLILGGESDPGKPAVQAVATAVIDRPTPPLPVAATAKSAAKPTTKSLPAPVPEASQAGFAIKTAGDALAVESLYSSKKVDDVIAPNVTTATPARPQSKPVQPGVDNEQSIDIEAMLAQVKREAKNSALAEHPVPFLSALSQQQKDKVPTIYYTRHDYSGRAAQSTVTLNGETVGAGTSLGNALRVEEVLPDSVVVSHKGTQFRLRALNSWINL